MQNNTKLNEAKAIFEFKAGYHALTLLPKAISQLDYNKKEGTNGLFHLKDIQRIIKFKTSEDTKKIIVIYNTDDKFLPIFVDPKYESGLKIRMALNQISHDDILMIESTLDKVNKVISENKIVVVNKYNMTVNLLNENELYSEFYKYYNEFKSQDGLNKITNFLFKKMISENELFELIQKREYLINSMSEKSYKLFYDEFKIYYPSSKEQLKYRTASVIRKAIISENNKYKGKLTKFYKTLKTISQKKEEKLKNAQPNEYHQILINYQKGYSNLNKQILKEKKKLNNQIRYLNIEFKKFLKKTVNYQGIQLNFNELDNMIYKILYKTQRDSSSVGTEFEKLVEINPKLQKEICLKAGLEYTDKSKCYFTFTHGISDIDMAIV